MMVMGVVSRWYGPTIACTRLRCRAANRRLHVLVAGLIAWALSRSRAAGEAGTDWRPVEIEGKSQEKVLIS
jgi:hypothetical protein